MNTIRTRTACMTGWSTCATADGPAPAGSDRTCTADKRPRATAGRGAGNRHGGRQARECLINGPGSHSVVTEGGGGSLA